jgi:hypothetical protein
MAVSDAVRLEREKRKTARQAAESARADKLYDVLLSPNVVRLGLVAGIIAYSTYCARSESNVGPVQSALAFALPGIGIPLIASDAGIKDKWALAAISSAGISYTTGQAIAGWAGAGIDWPHEAWAAITPWKD